MVNKPIHREIADYIKDNITGCKFVGIDETNGELFLTFDHDDGDLIVGGVKNIQNKFSEVKKAVIVEKINVDQATELVNQLNEFLEQDKKDIPDLLNLCRE